MHHTRFLASVRLSPSRLSVRLFVCLFVSLLDFDTNCIRFELSERKGKEADLYSAYCQYLDHLALRCGSYRVTCKYTTSECFLVDVFLSQTLSQATGERLRRAFDKCGIVLPPGDNGANLFEHERSLAGFRNCPVCLLMAPPRSYHCKVCNCCVLKRDHHCFFTASCVGFNNQRYFVVFAFYTTVSCAVGALLIAHHLNSAGGMYTSIKSWLHERHFNCHLGSPDHFELRITFSWTPFSINQPINRSISQSINPHFWFEESDVHCFS